MIFVRAEDLKPGMTLRDGRVIRCVGVVGAYWSIELTDDSSIGLLRKRRVVYRQVNGELRKEAE
jgi:hypothetical protein